MSVGILSCAAHIPVFRIKTADIALANKVEISTIKELGVIEKSVASPEDDSLTLAYKACFQAIQNLKKRAKKFEAKQIEAVFVGSETHPYAVKSTSSMLASFLDIGNEYYAADLQFTCKAGTSALITVANMVKAGSAKYGLAVGSDVAKVAPKDRLEYTASSGAAGFIVGKANNPLAIAKIIETASFNSDTPDFWRNEKSPYPSHAGRFSGVSYTETIQKTIELILDKTGLNPKDFDHLVLHMPNAKLPKIVAKKLGFTEKQLKSGFVVPYLGNSYTSSSLIGLISVLEQAKPNQKILVCSYGSGAGSDALYIETTAEILNFKPKATVAALLNKKIYV